MIEPRLIEEELNLLEGLKFELDNPLTLAFTLGAQSALTWMKNDTQAPSCVVMASRPGVGLESLH